MNALRKLRVLFIVLLTLGILVGLFAGYTWVTLKWSYAQGERTGYVQKFSLKGWFCKTHEGELTMLPVEGMVPEKFPFTVRDEKVAEAINQGMGQKMVLTYEQHIGVPLSCFGETEYFVTAAKVVDAQPPSPSSETPSGPVETLSK